jgi:hypothetical protein
MKLSEQQVHSNPCTQITGVRGLVSIAWAIFGTNEGDSPKAAAVSEQYFMNERRVIPWRRITS